MYQNGIDYYDSLGLDSYGFTDEEKAQICGFYDLCSAGDYGVYPISREELEEMKDWSAEFLPEVCLLWSNRNSNYAGVYLSGPLKGKVCIIDHEEEMYVPLYRSIQSFTAAVASRQLTDLYNEDPLKAVPKDYPSLNAGQAEKESDLTIAKTLIQQMDEDPDMDDYRYGMAVCYLMPDTNLDLLKPFLFKNNMWVQEAACYVLALHQYAPALEWLEEISRTGKGNAKFAATRSLKYIKCKNNKNNLQD